MRPEAFEHCTLEVAGGQASTSSYSLPVTHVTAHCSIRANSLCRHALYSPIPTQHTPAPSARVTYRLLKIREWVN